MAIKALFTKELRRLQYPDDRFLALLRNNGQLDPASLKVKDRVRDISLFENGLISLIVQYRFSSPHFAKKGYRIERQLHFAFHNRISFPVLYSPGNLD